MIDIVRNTQVATSRRRVFVGFPGPTMGTMTSQAIWETASREHFHQVALSPFKFENFNGLWVWALNEAEAGRFDTLAIVHADLELQDYWVDVLAAEMERLDAHVISVAIPKKSPTGAVSCCIGHPTKLWRTYRTITLREMYDPKLNLPETFNAADYGYPGCPLLFNSGCVLIDLRQPLFRTTDEQGRLVALFKWDCEFGRVQDGTFGCRGVISEDFYFARRCHELGAKAYVTRKVKLSHIGDYKYTNYEPWGSWEHDEENADLWRDGEKRKPEPLELVRV